MRSPQAGLAVPCAGGKGEDTQFDSESIQDKMQLFYAILRLWLNSNTSSTAIDSDILKT